MYKRKEGLAEEDLNRASFDERTHPGAAVSEG